VSANYEMNGLTVGYSYASAAAETTSNDGVQAAQSAFGVSYAFGDLVVSAGKQTLKDAATSPDAVISATYTLNADALTVVAQMDNYHSATDSNDYQINVSYAVSDALTLSSEVDKNKTTTMVATYTAGAMTATVAKTDDDTTDASISLNYGNADLTIGRVGARAGATFTTGNRAAADEYRQ
jgi:predicted porin